MAYEQSLIKAGLTKDQAAVYETLIKFGPMQARYIYRRAQVSRPLTYRALQGLIEAGLVDKKDEPKKVSLFVPAHPLKLKEFIEKKREEVDDANQALVGILPKLSSDFNLISGKPGVRFFEGIEGVREVYEDILATGKDFQLVRSIIAKEYEKEMSPTVKEFIKLRVRKGISVTALTPADVKPDPKQDRGWKLKRTVIPVEDYNSPVEINIYGNKVAFLSYEKEMVSFLIDSPQIAEAMRQLFKLAQKAGK